MAESKISLTQEGNLCKIIYDRKNQYYKLIAFFVIYEVAS